MRETIKAIDKLEAAQARSPAPPAAPAVEAAQARSPAPPAAPASRL
jgi:hypothetical protein